MFELPEIRNFARQMNRTLKGKTVREGRLGNSPHKFVWYNRSHADFKRLTGGKKVGETKARGKWLFVPLEPGYVMLVGECGGRLLYHPGGSGVPEKYHLLMAFTDGSFLSAMTPMWGAYELYEEGAEQERQYVKGMRPAPLEEKFTLAYFSTLVDEISEMGKRSVKGLFTQDQIIPGLGNAITQDILFRAGLHPRHPIGNLSRTEKKALFDAIQKTVREACAKGGRNDELDLLGKKGGYIRIMDASAAGNPCPVCGTLIKKMQYLGGACYFCPQCQR